jgi:hypothetical protein
VSPILPELRGGGSGVIKSSDWEGGDAERDAPARATLLETAVDAAAAGTTAVSVCCLVDGSSEAIDVSLFNDNDDPAPLDPCNETLAPIFALTDDEFFSSPGDDDDKAASAAKTSS